MSKERSRIIATAVAVASALMMAATPFAALAEPAASKATAEGVFDSRSRADSVTTALLIEARGGMEIETFEGAIDTVPAFGAILIVR